MFPPCLSFRILDISSCEGLRGGYKGFRKATRGYRGLQGLTEGYKGLQGVTKVYKGLQGKKKRPLTRCVVFGSGQFLTKLILILHPKFLTPWYSQS